MTLNTRTWFDIYCTKTVIKVIVLSTLTVCMMVIVKTFSPELLKVMTMLSGYLRSISVTESIIIVFMLYVVCNAPTMFPTNVLHVMCGLLYGFVYGTTVAICCYTVSVIIPFELTRRCFKNHVHSFIKDSQYYSLISVINDRPIFILLCSRMSPIIPGSLNNLLFGLTEINIVSYAMFSAMGISPQIIFFTYIGSIVSDISDFQEKAQSNTAIMVIGIVSTIAMLGYMTIKANSVLKNVEKKNNNDVISDNI